MHDISFTVALLSTEDKTSHILRNAFYVIPHGMWQLECTTLLEPI